MSEDLKSRIMKAIDNIIIEGGELTQNEKENIVSDILGIIAISATEREKKLIKALNSIIYLVEGCYWHVSISEDEELKTFLSELGIVTPYTPNGKIIG